MVNAMNGENNSSEKEQRKKRVKAVCAKALAQATKIIDEKELISLDNFSCLG